MNKRKMVIGTGWKLYINTVCQAVDMMKALGRIAQRYPEIETFLFPAAPHLTLAKELLSNTPMGYGLQNICEEESGNYTGENSILLLKDLGGQYAEVGHAERRSLYGESDIAVNQKMRLCQKHDIRPVVCVGEQEESIARGYSRLGLKSQCLWALDAIEPEFLEKVILVYEPVWAIGKAKPAEPDYVQDVHAYLRSCVTETHGKEGADKLRIMYGGSNTPQTSAGFLEKPDIDGLFVGRSALIPENFEAILQLAANR